MCLLLQFCLCVTILRSNKKHCNIELSLKLVRWTKAQYSKVCAWDSLFHRGNELDESIDISSTIQVFLFLCSALCLYLSLFPLNTRLPYSSCTCACIDCLHQNVDINIIPIQYTNVVINDYIPEIASLFLLLILFCFLLYRVIAVFQGDMALWSPPSSKKTRTTIIRSHFRGTKK